MFPTLYVKVICKNEHHSNCAIISGTHSNFSYIEKDGKVFIDEPLNAYWSLNSDVLNSDFKASVEVEDIIKFSNNIPEDTASLLLKAAHTNLIIAHHALKEDYGLSNLLRI